MNDILFVFLDWEFKTLFTNIPDVNRATECIIHYSLCTFIGHSTIEKFRKQILISKEAMYSSTSLYNTPHYKVDFNIYHGHVLAPKWLFSYRSVVNEPRCEKTGFLHMRKQRRRSAAQQLRS